jgi:hypothetical protein
MKIHTKLKRLFAAVAARKGTLTSQQALAAAMKVSEPAITQWFGYGRDDDPLPLTQPAARLGQLVGLFREAGIPIELHWLEVPLEEFERLLRASTGIDAKPNLSWTDAVRRHARSYDGLQLRRPVTHRPVKGGGYRLKLEGDPPAPPIDRFHIDERVYLSLELPEKFLDQEAGMFAVVVHEAPHKATCLYPLEASNCMPITEEVLRLPEAKNKCFLVSEPVGVQRVHTVLTRSRPQALVHARLAEIDLHLGLDRLASELTERPTDSWALLSLTYQAVEGEVRPDKRAL